MLKANPAALASRRRAGKRTDSITPNERQKAIRPLSEEQIEALLNEARADREYYPLLLTLARTGVRPGEAMALQWDDLDFSNREILIERALSAGQIGTTKTGGVRRVDMSQTLAETLSQLFIERRRKHCAESGPRSRLGCSSTARVSPSMIADYDKRLARDLSQSRLIRSSRL